MFHSIRSGPAGDGFDEIGDRARLIDVDAIERRRPASGKAALAPQQASIRLPVFDHSIPSLINKICGEVLFLTRSPED